MSRELGALCLAIAAVLCIGCDSEHTATLSHLDDSPSHKWALDRASLVWEPIGSQCYVTFYLEQRFGTFDVPRSWCQK